MPSNIRATGTATGYAIFNLIVIMLTQVTPLAIEEISWRYFLIFVICDVIFIVIFVLWYPGVFSDRLRFETMLNFNRDEK